MSSATVTDRDSTMLDTCERGLERAQAMYVITKSSYWLESAKKWAELKTRVLSK
jgi:hypothetical protein